MQISNNMFVLDSEQLMSQQMRYWGLIQRRIIIKTTNEPVYDMLVLSSRRKSVFKHACATNSEAWFEPSSTLFDRVCEHLRLWIGCADWYVCLSLGNSSYICGFYIVFVGGRKSLLLCFVCLPGVSCLLCGSSSQYHGFVIVVYPDQTDYFLMIFWS